MAAVTRRKRRRTTIQQHASPQPTSATGVLPEDLMIEILSRVPVSDPLELRCVCKLWKSLVSDTQFVKNHLYRSFTELNDLASKALDDMIAFEIQLNYAPAVADAEEEEEEEEEEEDAEEEEEEEAEEEEVEVEEEEVEAEGEHALRKELDNMLVVVRSLKESLETIKDDMNAIKDRMKCLQSFLQIYLKTVTTAAAAATTTTTTTTTSSSSSSSSESPSSE